MKGGEIGLPKCGHFHVTLLVNVPCPKFHALERVSSKVYTELFRASTVVFKADFVSVLELTNRVSCGQVH